MCGPCPPYDVCVRRGLSCLDGIRNEGNGLGVVGVGVGSENCEIRMAKIVPFCLEVTVFVRVVWEYTPEDCTASAIVLL